MAHESADDWFTFGAGIGLLGSGVAQAWFWYGSGLVWVWFRSGAIMVQVWFRSGSGMVHVWFRSGSGLVPTSGSGVVNVRSGASL